MLHVNQVAGRMLSLQKRPFPFSFAFHFPVAIVISFTIFFSDIFFTFDLDK